MAAELRRLVTSTLEDRDKAIGIGFLIAFVITVVGANWALLTYGIVPIGFGLDAPASVYFVGLTFTFRDGLRERLGFKGALLAIAIGGILSYILEIRQDGDLFARIALASAAAFAVSEFADARRLRADPRVLAAARDHRQQHRRAGRRLGAVPDAGVRLARVPHRPGRRQVLHDGAGDHPDRRLGARTADARRHRLTPRVSRARPRRWRARRPRCTRSGTARPSGRRSA